MHLYGITRRDDRLLRRANLRLPFIMQDGLVLPPRYIATSMLASTVRAWQADKQVASANARARRYRAPGILLAEEWDAMRVRFGHRCLRCGCLDAMTIDHIQPMGKGGSNWIANIQPLCSECNTIKAHRTIDYRRGR